MTAITFGGPIAHTSPLFLELQILKLEDIYRLSIFLPMSVSTTLLQFILGIILLRYNTRSAFHGDLFLVRKNTVQYGLRFICFNGVKP